MTAADLISPSDQDIVFEGERVREFFDWMDSIKSLFSIADQPSSEAKVSLDRSTVIRIVGRRLPADSPNSLGKSLGREWSYETK